MKNYYFVVVHTHKHTYRQNHNRRNTEAYSRHSYKEKCFLCFSLALQFDFSLHWGDDTSTACRYILLHCMSCREQKIKRRSTMWNRRSLLHKFHSLVCLLVSLKSIPRTVKCLWTKKAAQKRFSVRTVWIKQNKRYKSSMRSVWAIIYDLLLLVHTVSLPRSLLHAPLYALL